VKPRSVAGGVTPPEVERATQGRELPVGVAPAVGFLLGEIAVSFCAAHSPLRFVEIAPSCAPPLRSTPLATAHRNDYEQNHEDDRDRD
jgi:hypothetical protein